jgi:hypothetical protein
VSGPPDAVAGTIGHAPDATGRGPMNVSPVVRALILLLTAGQLIKPSDDDRGADNLMIRLARRFLRTTDDYGRRQAVHRPERQADADGDRRAARGRDRGLADVPEGQAEVRDRYLADEAPS